MNTDRGTYKSYRISVSEEFETVFSHFYFAENNSENTIKKTLLPSFQTIMVFNFGTKALLASPADTTIKIERCIVLGPIKQAFNYSLFPGTQILVANFKGDAFYRFFGQAVVSGHFPINPDKAFLENCFSYLWHQLNEIGNVEDKVNCILNFCKPYLTSQRPIPTLLANFASKTDNPIKSVAQETGMSERNIQLLHKKHFGFSAKELSRYSRFIKAIEYIQQLASSTGHVNWFELIETCGYYDQSQLIHDFTHYIRCSPKNFLKFQQDICRASGE